MCLFSHWCVDTNGRLIRYRDKISQNLTRQIQYGDPGGHRPRRTTSQEEDRDPGWNDAKACSPVIMSIGYTGLWDFVRERVPPTVGYFKLLVYQNTIVLVSYCNKYAVTAINWIHLPTTYRETFSRISIWTQILFSHEQTVLILLWIWPLD